MHWNKLIPLFLLLLSNISLAAASSPYETTVYTLPTHTDGTASNCLSLDGQWQVRISPKGKWHKVTVPGELAMQGLAVNHDTPFTYSRKFTVPTDFAGKKIILRFNGTYSYATLYINGKQVTTHRGGFTRWETDVTSYLHPGKSNEISLTLIDPVEEISYASGYAHHPIGGILRSVMLFAQPLHFFTDLRIDALLDSAYTNGSLAISLNCDSLTPSSALRAQLISPSGDLVTSTQFSLSRGANSFDIPVQSPEKWDAEHPRLYTLQLEFLHNDKSEASITRKIGFRKIEIKDSRMLVNGSPVKLRGACRHDIHPILGRATDRATDSIDARLFKEANMNFVRTSHYPPSEDFLEFCDRYGIYVECESAVCFINTHRQKNYAPGASQDDPAHTPQYLGQLSEMAKNFQSHPAILFWSIGNESQYGSNFQLSYDWIKNYDTTRPAIFSYPGSVPQGKKPIYDIASMHYQDINGNLWQWGIESHGFEVKGYPTIFDEWAHPACYTYATLQHDPGIREFWGKSLDMMWDGVYRAPGALGGAIWGYIDEIFFLPKPKEGTSYWKEFAHTAKPEGFRGECVGYGEWGIVDVYRRKKPEFWATKKAYSPVRIETPRYIHPVSGTDLLLDIYNRFDHTDLSETHAIITYRNEKSEIDMPRLSPHQKSILRIPAQNWQPGDSIVVEINDNDRQLIDRYIFTIPANGTTISHSDKRSDSLKISETPDFIIIENSSLKIPFSKADGLIANVTVGGDTVITRGPWLNAYINYNHLTGAEVRKISNHLTISPADWQLSSLNARILPSGNVIAEVSGRYNDIHLIYQIVITPCGEISTTYSAEGLPDGYLRETGLSFDLPDNYASLEWVREGYWDNYPADAMSGNSGKTNLYNSAVQDYGERPSHSSWASDTKDFYYWGDSGSDSTRPLTIRAKAMKENVRQYSLSAPSGAHLSVLSHDADVACRLDKPDGKQLTLYCNNKWDYPEIAWGNFCKVLSPIPTHGTITLRTH